MSRLKIQSRNTDYDAAQALLDLQSNTKPESRTMTRVWAGTEGKEDMEKAAKLIWSCFISSEVQAPSTNAPQKNKLRYLDSSQLPSKRLCHLNESNDTSSERSFINSAKVTPNISRNDSNDHNKERVTVRITREIGTQTEEITIHPKILLMEKTIKNLCEKIKSLEAQIKVPNSDDYQSVDKVDQESSEAYSCDNEDDDPNYDDTITDNSYEQKYEPLQSQHSINGGNGSQTRGGVFSSRVLTNHNVDSKLCDRVPIGEGNATVPVRLLKHMNWNSYSSATRKLLTAVFSRRVLATHSLTGKPSPAFPNKPAKKRLDPALVNDIVQTVVERCCVPENVVRTSITTKCADESKMLRTRQKNNKKRPSKRNRENVPPSTSESDSDI